jgi:hypothetical protein
MGLPAVQEILARKDTHVTRGNVLPVDHSEIPAAQEKHVQWRAAVVLMEPVSFVEGWDSPAARVASVHSIIPSVLKGHASGVDRMEKDAVKEITVNARDIVERMNCAKRIVGGGTKRAAQATNAPNFIPAIQSKNATPAAV